MADLRTAELRDRNTHATAANAVATFLRVYLLNNLRVEPTEITVDVDYQQVAYININWTSLWWAGSISKYQLEEMCDALNHAKLHPWQGRNWTFVSVDTWDDEEGHMRGLCFTLGKRA